MRTRNTSPSLQYSVLLPFSKDMIMDLVKRLESDKCCTINLLKKSSSGLAFIASMASEDATSQPIEALVLQEDNQV